MAAPRCAWARAALQRNPDLEVVATDQQTGVVTIKHRGSGEVEAVKASELAAVSPAQLKAMNTQRSRPEARRRKNRASG